MYGTRAWLTCLTLSLAAMARGAQPDKVEQALREVRDVKAALFSRSSGLLGRLPGPAEIAAHQMRCRPIPRPEAGVPREIRFDAQTIERAAGLDPVELRKAKGRMGMRVLPLGITGAYVSEFLKRNELLVVHVLEESPAGGVLQLNDAIIGANGRLFEDPEDPRPEMGNALAESQSPKLGGILTLHVVRDRKPTNVKIDLGDTLSYSDTWPFGCEKSRRIRKAALDFVMSQYPWHRYNFWTPTFLMASGDDAALELARRHLCAGLKDEYEENTGASAWRGGYRLTNLCEYYLLTGDSSVLPAIRHQAEGVAWAQYRSGSWSHGAGKGPNVPAPGTAGGGYGEVNNAGLGAFTGLCLARQCGIEPYDHTLPRSIRFFGKFCGSNLPYGLGAPSARGGRMDNGMNSMAAVAFHLLGEDEMAERWARTVCPMWMGRERGHAEAIFSAAWGPVGAALAPEEEFHGFMNHMRWAYEMGRTRDGGLTFMRGSRWTYPNMTAAMGLFLWLPERRLQILGGESVFAPRPPRGLERAAELYKRKKWKELRTFLTDYIKAAEKSEPASAGDLAYAGKLLAAYERLEKHAAATLEIIEESIQSGMPATAQTQLDLLARMLGEEREEAARLRRRLGEGKLKDRRRPKPEPLVDHKELVKKLGLAKGGVGDGFAHSPDYIAETNKQGFEGMALEQIAGFLGHFSGGPASGAAAALAERGEEALPLLKRLLADPHCGVRAGAVDALTRMYRHDGDEYRADVPADLAVIVKLLRPMTADPSPLVRDATGGFIKAIKVLNKDVYDILAIMARSGANVEDIVRHGIKDPEVRTRLCMELVDAANRRRSTVPAEYKPIGLAESAHLELCRPYLQTAIDTLNNPRVLNMYGFFSNTPPNAALRILERYAEDPFVPAHLTDVLRFAARKRGSMDSYWYPIIEYPHRIVVRIGPAALPKVKAFCESEAALYRRLQADEAARPSWWKEDTPEFFDTWRREMERTAEPVRCLQGERPPEDAIPSMCSIYLSSRAWGAWERQRIRDRITDLGVEAVPFLRQAFPPLVAPLRAGFDERIASRQAKAEGEKDRRRKRDIQKEIETVQAQRAALDERVAELEELAALIELFNVRRPSDADVRALCAFYVKRPWGNRYPFIKHDLSYMRPLYDRQLALARDTLTRWRGETLPTLRAFIEKDKQTLAGALTALDEEEKFWKPQWARKSKMPLARIAQEREDIKQIRSELGDLADLIECASQDRLSRERIAVLCRIFTRRGWPSQKALIRDLLKRAGAKAIPAIREHVHVEEEALPRIVAEVESHMSNTVKVRVKWRYDRARTREVNLRRGIQGLEDIARAIR